MTGGSGERWQVEVDARLTRLELRADEAELAGAGLGLQMNAAGTSKEEYPDLESWVSDYFRAVFSRPLGGEFRWCENWREHREAVIRLDALWQSWKSFRYAPSGGMATWLQHFLDPQLVTLLGVHGPFAGCSASRHEDLPGI